MAKDDSRLYEQRRYSCVAFSLPAVDTAEGILRVLNRRYLDVLELESGEDAWRLFEGVVRDKQAFYPPGLREIGRGEDGYTYAAYLGVRKSESGTIAALALPYKRLFGRMESDVFVHHADTTPSYICFDMVRLYRSLEVERSSGRVTRISVKVSGEPGVGMVSISGSSPLQSGIWSALEESVEPYGLRLELDRAREDLPALRLYIDRVGNAHWHQRDVDDLPLAFSGLAELVEIGGQQTAHLPTKGQALDDADVMGGDDVV